MKVMVVSKDPDNTVQYLKQAGYEALPVYANDMTVMLARQKNIKVAVYFQPYAVPESHEKALKEMLEADVRVILVAPRDDNIVPYAAALGVYDLLTLPLNNEDLINAIENPGTNFNAAEWVKGVDYKIKPSVPDESEGDKAFKPEKPPKPAKPKTESRPGIIKQLLDQLSSRSDKKEQVVFVSHPLVVVWNPTGHHKSVTALNLAVAASRSGFNTGLAEFDLFCPLLDVWFEIPQTGVEESGVDGAGIMTFGGSLQPNNHIPKMLKKSKWGVYYLPAGNKLGNIGTPEISMEQFEQVIRAIYQRNVNGQPAVTIINTGSSFEYPPTITALRQASVVVIPIDGSPHESELVKQHLKELERVNIKPKTVELLWDLNGISKVKQICDYRLSLPAEPELYLKSAISGKPYCLSSNSAVIWEQVVKEIFM